MQAHYPSHTQHSSRPRLPDYRPHTAYASSPTQFIPDEREEPDLEDQTTPRASLAGLSILAESARLSRDAVAPDVSMSAALYDDDENNNNHAKFLKAPLASRDPCNATSQEDRLAQFRTQRRPRRTPFCMSGSGYGAAAAAAAASTTDSSAESASFHSKTASLGRRFSRSYKDKMSELRESVSKHAPLAGKMRRSSTPHASDAFVPGEGCINPAVLLPVLPSSKRNARNLDGRPKKLRSGLLGFSERKDTPAPPTFNLPQQRPLSHISTPLAGFQLAGGEGARAAAAKINHDVLFNEDIWQQEEDLRFRRSRLGSLSSAADSGADLTFSGGSCNDSVQDVDVMDVDEPQKPSTFDILKQLPSEISLQILEYLDAAALAQAECVSHYWQSLINETCVWRAAYLGRYQRQVYTHPPPIQVGGVGVGRPKKPDQQWKKMYAARLALDANWRKGARDAGKAIYLSGHTDSVYCLQFDEDKIITGSRDRTIRVWDINTFRCLRVIGGPAYRPVQDQKVLRTVDYPDFHIATPSVNGKPDGDEIYQVPADWHDASILCLQYDDRILVTGSSDSDLLVWDIKTFAPIKRLKRHTGGVLDVALDARHIVSCSKDSRIIVWDRQTLEPKGELAGHRGPVNAVQLRGKLLVSASGDGIARLWDLEQMKLVKEFPAKERGLAAVEFSDDTRHVLAGGNDHITYKFETETGREVVQFTGHSQLVRSLWLDSANSRVVSGSYDLDLRVYDFETGHEIWRAEEWTTSWMLAAKSDYRRIVATSQDGRILMVDFGLIKGGYADGQPMEGVELLRGTERTGRIEFRNPWLVQGEGQGRSDSPVALGVADGRQDQGNLNG